MVVCWDRTWQPGPVPHPRQELSSQGHWGSPSPGHWTPSWGLAEEGWDMAWLSRAHGQAGQGCGELKTMPPVTLLGQELLAPGG